MTNNDIYIVLKIINESKNISIQNALSKRDDNIGEKDFLKIIVFLEAREYSKRYKNRMNISEIGVKKLIALENEIRKSEKMNIQSVKNYITKHTFLNGKEKHFGISLSLRYLEESIVQ